MIIFNSIKWRLQLWYGLLLVLVLAALGVSAHRLDLGRTLMHIDGDLHRHAGNVANSLRRPGDTQRQPPEDSPDAPPEQQQPPPQDGEPETPSQPPRSFHLPQHVAALFDEADTNGFYYAIIWRDGNMIAHSANFPDAERGDFLRPQPREQRDARTLSEDPPRMFGTLRELRIITPPGEIILAGRNIAPELADLRAAAVRLAATGAIVLLAGLAGGWFFVGRALRPVSEISSAAAKISGGDLSQRINTAETESELGGLAATLNTTFARLEAAFARQQQFTSDAAHELRTPVSVILTQTQSTLNKQRTAAEYRETLEACQRAAQRMRRLTASLLELARLDAGQETLRREKFALDAAAQNCIEQIRPLAAEKNLTIQTSLVACDCTGDAERIAQVITNLLSNAISYNKPGGEIRAATRIEDGLAVLSVADTGGGIAPEDLPRVFDRFYRADKSRTGAAGAGLGLAICKAIVESNGGTIAAANAKDGGAVFTVRLPLK